MSKENGDYRVQLDVYNGPLDLLLYLVRREEVDIYDIPIARITEQYLAYLERMPLMDLDSAGDFLLMAATLMRIKARMLLPKVTEEEEPEEDPRRELVDQLLEYQKFKEAASTLKDLEKENGRLKRERSDFQKALSKQTKTANTLKESYETLKKGSSEYLSLKASYEKASEDLATKTKSQAELEEELKALQKSQTLQWFLGGACVLFVGLIVGYMSRRPRRRPSLL